MVTWPPDISDLPLRDKWATTYPRPLGLISESGFSNHASLLPGSLQASPGAIPTTRARSDPTSTTVPTISGLAANVCLHIRSLRTRRGISLRASSLGVMYCRDQPATAKRLELASAI